MQAKKATTIIPQNVIQIIDRAIVNMTAIGKVSKGQNVNIKLNVFPYMEFSLLRSIVNNVSLVSGKKKGYITEMILTEGMLSSNKEQLSTYSGY